MNCSEKAKEQALQVLKHFNVQVSLADIFSRCQVGQGCCELKLVLACGSLRSGRCGSVSRLALRACRSVPRISAGAREAVRTSAR